MDRGGGDGADGAADGGRVWACVALDKDGATGSGRDRVVAGGDGGGGAST